MANIAISIFHYVDALDENLFSGGNQTPGNTLLALTPSWLSKRPSTHTDGLQSLYIHKAITFKDGGRSYLDVFDPPRQVTYFMNYFGRSLSRCLRMQSEELEVSD